MKLPAFEYRCPEQLSEAIELLAASNGEAKVLAGGQSLIPLLAFRLADPALLLDLRKIAELRIVDLSATELRIGAMVRWHRLETDPDITIGCPILTDAVQYIAHYQIRNRGTIGGSVAHADPAAEMPGISVLCDATIDIVGADGARSVPASRFFLAPLVTSLDPAEIVVSICFPRWPTNRKWAFEEFSMRRGDFALAAVGLFYDEDLDGRASNAHIVVIGSTDLPCRLPMAEATLNGQLIDSAVMEAVANAAAAEVRPPDDLHASEAYRRSLVATLVERALTKAIQRK